MSYVSLALAPGTLESLQKAMAKDAELAGRALASAVRKTAQWTRNESLRRLSAGVGITRSKLIKAKRVAAHTMNISGTDQFFSFSFNNGAPRKQRRYQGSVWIGTKDIKAIYLKGNARQTKAGVRQGSKFYQGAFLATMKSGHLGIFERRGKSRLPIVEVGQPIDATALFGDINPIVSAKLEQNLHHELDYYFNIRSAA